MMQNTIIDIEKLKDDPFLTYLLLTSIDNKRRRDVYWHHYRKMISRSNIVSIPLLIVTSITGFTSVANLSSDSSSYGIRLIVTIFGISSAVLSALQKYFRYSERAEHSKHLAKSYAKIARRIENTIMLIKSNSTIIKQESFQKFFEEIQKESESLLQEIDDIPKELLNDTSIYSDMIEKYKKINEEETERVNSERSERQKAEDELTKMGITAFRITS